MYAHPLVPIFTISLSLELLTLKLNEASWHRVYVEQLPASGLFYHESLRNSLIVAPFSIPPLVSYMNDTSDLFRLIRVRGHDLLLTRLVPDSFNPIHHSPVYDNST